MVKFFRINRLIDENMLNRFRLFLDKIKDRSDIEYIYLIFDTNGGKTICAAKIIDLMNKSKFKFIGKAYRGVHSAAVHIFLSTHVRYGTRSASALIHRIKKTDPNLSDKKCELVEKQIFDFIALKLSVSLTDVYKMANDGNGTIITMDHPLGKRFFIGN